MLYMGYAPLILFVADLFHPVDGLAVELFLNGDMGHGRGWRGAMPVLLTGRNQTTSPGRISSIGPPQRCARPQPAVTIRVWPSGWVCHAVRAPGSKVTLAPTTRAGAGGLNSGSIRTVPVNYSAGPLPEGCEPLRLISIFELLRVAAQRPVICSSFSG